MAEMAAEYKVLTEQSENATRRAEVRSKVSTKSPSRTGRCCDVAMVIAIGLRLVVFSN
jgi:hypothetical protein